MSSKKADRVERKKRKISAFLKLVEEDDSKKPKLDDCDYEALKAKLRARKKLLQVFPQFYLKRSGHDASIDVLPEQRKPLFFHDLQDLLGFALAGDRSTYKPYSWCKLEKWNKLEAMTVLVFEGLGLSDYVTHRESFFSRWDPLFPNQLHFVPPQSSLPREFALLALSTNLKNNILSGKSIQEALSSKALFHFPIVSEAAKKVNKSLRVSFLLNPRQMLECGYPMPIPGYYEEKYKEYVPTSPEYKGVSNESPLFCIDCEMCMTTAKKLELTSICMVDENCKVVYHSLVKPHNPITNYLTQYSGITEKLLRPVTTRLIEVQKAIQEILTPDSILVGHSLNSDMDAIQMMHPYVIDTSQIYNLSGERKRRSKLALLTKLFLGKVIQNAGPDGHCPMEDAVSTMELVHLKLKNGYHFGDVLLRGARKDLEVTKLGDDYKGSFFDINCKDKELKIIGNAESLCEYDSLVPDGPRTLFQSENVDEIYETTCKSAVENDLTICHIPSHEVNEESAKKLWKITKRVWKSVPMNSLFIMIWPGGEEQEAFVGITMKEDPQRKKILKEF